MDHAHALRIVMLVFYRELNVVLYNIIVGSQFFYT